MRITAKARASRCRQRSIKVSVGLFSNSANNSEHAQRQPFEIAYDSSERPDPYVGPVEVVITAGRGRGLVVTSDVPAGTLLLLCHPLTVLTGTPGTALAPSELVTHFQQDLAQSHAQELLLQHRLQQQNSEHADDPLEQHLQQSSGTWVSLDQSSILDSLFDGSQSSAAASPMPLHQLAAACISHTQPTLPATHDVQRQGLHKLADGRLQRIIEFNCKGEDNGDPAAWLCRGETQSAYIGLFPALALINHSCSPNSSCCGLAGGSALAVRTSIDLSRGDEVMISYLGRYISSPASTRQELLRYSYGFACDCKRCTAEGRQSPWSDPDLIAAWIRLDPFLKQAVMQGLTQGADPRPLRDLESRLLRAALSARAAAAQLSSFQQPKVDGDPSLNLASQAQIQTFTTPLVTVSAPAFGFQMQAADVSSTATIIVAPSPQSIITSIVEETIAYSDDTANLPSTVSVISFENAPNPATLASLDLLLLMAAPPGSYSHCALAMSHLSHLQETVGEEHPSTQQAMTVAIDAHIARYGETSALVLPRLMAAHQTGKAALALVSESIPSGTVVRSKPLSLVSTGISVLVKLLGGQR